MNFNKFLHSFSFNFILHELFEVPSYVFPSVINFPVAVLVARPCSKLSSQRPWKSVLDYAFSQTAYPSQKQLLRTILTTSNQSMTTSALFSASGPSSLTYSITTAFLLVSMHLPFPFTICPKVNSQMLFWKHKSNQSKSSQWLTRLFICPLINLTSPPGFCYPSLLTIPGIQQTHFCLRAFVATVPYNQKICLPDAHNLSSFFLIAPKPVPGYHLNNLQFLFQHSFHQFAI